MGKIVAIGGGEIATGETRSIDRAIIALTGVDRPRALFVPTASSDSEGYWQVFRAVYGKRLGCRTDVLYLLGVSPTEQELRELEKQNLARALTMSSGRVFGDDGAAAMLGIKPTTLTSRLKKLKIDAREFQVRPE